MSRDRIVVDGIPYHVWREGDPPKGRIYQQNLVTGETRSIGWHTFKKYATAARKKLKGEQS